MRVGGWWGVAGAQQQNCQQWGSSVMLEHTATTCAVDTLLRAVRLTCSARLLDPYPSGSVLHAGLASVRAWASRQCRHRPAADGLGAGGDGGRSWDANFSKVHSQGVLSLSVCVCVCCVRVCAVCACVCLTAAA